MIKREFTFQSVDEITNIHAVEWLPEMKTIAVLQVSHGVTEYILRYEPLAKYLTDKGIAVVGIDDIGHGLSIASGKEPMYFGTEGSFKFVVEDTYTCYKMTKAKFKDVPYIMLGFSMGSYIARAFLIDYPDSVDAAILMGTGQTPPISIFLGKLMANKEAKKVGEDHTSSGIDKLTFGTYNKAFAPNRTEFDWLCKSEKNLDEYIADPMRGKAFTAGLFRELLSCMAYTGKKENIEKMNKNIPIFLISGSMDPVGECGKGVMRANAAFKKVGINDITVKLYDDLRHDILHEDNYQQIYNDLYNWIIEKVLNQK
ncbi:MAG: alpha/beta fold hydrolase [Clostridia bacterium]|nr:alpha/beta fold hydrolase [Clostridia bacterium]